MSVVCVVVWCIYSEMGGYSVYVCVCCSVYKENEGVCGGQKRVLLKLKFILVLMNYLRWVLGTKFGLCKSSSDPSLQPQMEVF